MGLRAQEDIRTGNQPTGRNQEDTKQDFVPGGENMTVVIYEDWVARGWKSIAGRLDCSVSFARKLFVNEGLPLVDEGGTWTLTAQDFRAWRDKRKRRRGKNT